MTHTSPPHPRGCGGFPVSTSSRKQIQVDLKGFPSTKRVGCCVCGGGGTPSQIPRDFSGNLFYFPDFPWLCDPAQPCAASSPVYTRSPLGLVPPGAQFGVVLLQEKDFSEQEQICRPWEGLGRWGVGGGVEGGRCFHLELKEE